MSHLRIPSDDEYINEFHKQWNEACLRTQERTSSMRFSHEFAKRQSERLAAIALLSDEELLKLRKQHSEVGQ